MLLQLLTNYSPNFSTKSRINKNIKFIILHYTGMISETKAIKRLSDVGSKVSCHYFIKRNGGIILMVPEKYIAWHAGKSRWGNTKNLNKYSIGIEIQNIIIYVHQSEYSFIFVEIRLSDSIRNLGQSGKFGHTKSGSWLHPHLSPALTT